MTKNFGGVSWDGWRGTRWARVWARQKTRRQGPGGEWPRPGCCHPIKTRRLTIQAINSSSCLAAARQFQLPDIFFWSSTASTQFVITTTPPLRGIGDALDYQQMASNTQCLASMARLSLSSATRPTVISRIPKFLAPVAAVATPSTVRYASGNAMKMKKRTPKKKKTYKTFRTYDLSPMEQMTLCDAMRYVRPSPALPDSKPWLTD